jgi:hypothetical protein
MGGGVVDEVDCGVVACCRSKADLGDDAYPGEYGAKKFVPISLLCSRLSFVPVFLLGESDRDEFG